MKKIKELNKNLLVEEIMIDDYQKEAILGSTEIHGLFPPYGHLSRHKGDNSIGEFT